MNKKLLLSISLLLSINSISAMQRGLEPCGEKEVNNVIKKLTETNNNKLPTREVVVACFDRDQQPAVDCYLNSLISNPSSANHDIGQGYGDLIPQLWTVKTVPAVLTPSYSSSQQQPRRSTFSQHGEDDTHSKILSSSPQAPFSLSSWLWSQGPTIPTAVVTTVAKPFVGKIIGKGILATGASAIIPVAAVAVDAMHNPHLGAVHVVDYPKDKIKSIYETVVGTIVCNRVPAYGLATVACANSSNGWVSSLGTFFFGYCAVRSAYDSVPSGKDFEQRFADQQQNPVALLHEKTSSEERANEFQIGQITTAEDLLSSHSGYRYSRKTIEESALGNDAKKARAIFAKADRKDYIDRVVTESKEQFTKPVSFAYQMVTETGMFKKTGSSTDTDL